MKRYITECAIWLGVMFILLIYVSAEAEPGSWNMVGTADPVDKDPRTEIMAEGAPSREDCILAMGFAAISIGASLDLDLYINEEKKSPLSVDADTGEISLLLYGPTGTFSLHCVSGDVVA